LPVVAAFGRRLNIAGTIDRVSPVRNLAIAADGEVIEAPEVEADRQHDDLGRESEPGEP